jgi:hypothetical protein
MNRGGKFKKSSKQQRKTTINNSVRKNENKKKFNERKESAKHMKHTYCGNCGL